MNKKRLLRKKAVDLRTKGYTYSEIQKKLGIRIAKSKLSYWCNKVILPGWYKSKVDKINKNSLKKARLIALDINKIKREKYLSLLKEKNSHLIKKIDVSQQKLLLSVLYLGEGAKYGRSSTLSLGSSSAFIIKFYLKLLKNCYFIDDSKFRVRIQCRFDQNIRKLEDYWEKVTKIDRKQFYPTYIDKRTQGKPTLKKDYMGVCTIHYFSKEIQIELIFLADAIIKKII
ncbi:hypothetical protein A2970_00970 [Candidatus Roizmanbacteria bacterium RIFCSPLOWO2_01_FULL_44_13]|uniref:Resolvase HTH domain-containing protein n=1 Tax=Candidatus Roizmanbacteria bacterium RIFCSPLOWO2_01_FULL_44_13 TaxID=1802069 RepID=A0A1F7JC80_9BACT|nr:MAG: hypothetical protein A2970_00970 [Candidatus Roizmanbacteria bacterium RIFCSPLOWO2_01_FULL_44_13]